MSLAARVIACLDVSDGRVVKGVNFANIRDAGDPVELAHAYFEQGADELVFLDIAASVENKKTTSIVEQTASQVFVPLTVGGGVRSTKDFDRLLRAGADKVAVNTAAVLNPALINEASKRFGNQCVVLSVDVRRSQNTESEFEITTHGGTRGTNRDALDWAYEGVARGAGEILLNSIDTDGTSAGFDAELIRAIRDRVGVPIIASGGAGHARHFVKALEAGANAVLAASVFHFGILSIEQVKAEIQSAGFAVRNKAEQHV